MEVAINSYSQILWTAAGLTVGLAVIVWFRTVRYSQSRVTGRRTANEQWQSLAEALSASDRGPISAEAANRLVRALDQAPDDAATLTFVAESLSLRPNDHQLLELVNRSHLRSSLHCTLLSGEQDRQVAALQLTSRLGATEQLPLVLVLALSPETAVARAAIQTLESIDPTSALDLLFRGLRTEGMWAFGQTLNLLRRDALDGWLNTYGDARLADVVTLLATLVQTETEPIRLACVDILSLVPHRMATQAIGRAARGSDVVASSAQEALRTTVSGRVLLAKLDLAQDNRDRAERRLNLSTAKA